MNFAATNENLARIRRTGVSVLARTSVGVIPVTIIDFDSDPECDVMVCDAFFPDVTHSVSRKDIEEVNPI